MIPLTRYTFKNQGANPLPHRQNIVKKIHIPIQLLFIYIYISYYIIFRWQLTLEHRAANVKKKVSQQRNTAASPNISYLNPHKRAGRHITTQNYNKCFGAVKKTQTTLKTIRTGFLESQWLTVQMTEMAAILIKAQAIELTCN